MTRHAAGIPERRPTRRWWDYQNQPPAKSWASAAYACQEHSKRLGGECASREKEHRPVGSAASRETR